MLTMRTVLLTYIFLLALCLCAIGLGEFSGPSVRKAVLPLAADGFKTVLGAVLGFLSSFAVARGQT